MKERIFVSSLSIVLIAALIAFAYHPWVECLLALLVAALTAVAVWEYEQFAKAKGAKTALISVISLAVLVVFAFFLSATSQTWKLLPLLVFLIAFLLLFSIHFGQRDGALVDLAVSTFGLLYIAVPMGMLLSILYLPPTLLHQDGREWLAYLLIVTKITDIGGYFGGNLWGKRKLAPMISPKKTIEGALIGLACSVAASFAFSLFSSGILLGKGESILLGLALGLVGQFGDLSESLLKRDANKKDSNALPGLGGALDSIDSLLFNAPILYWYLQVVKP